MFPKFGTKSGSPVWLTLLKALLVVSFLVGGFLLLRQVGQLNDILRALQHADIAWVVTGLVATALSYMAAGLTQYAAGSWQSTYHKMHMLQWAGNFVNRFLPLNIGSTAMVARHYQKHGRSPTEALTVATLPNVIGYIKNIIPFMILSPFTVAHVLKRYPIVSPPLWLYPVLLIILGVAIVLFSKYKKRIKRYWQEAQGGLKSIKDPQQLAVLIAASTAYTLLASTALLAAVQAVGTTLPLSDIFTLYILSVFGGAVVPTPGGIGGTEGFLIAGLTSLGIGFSTAVSITLLFRLMTFWAPLIPGAVALHLFRKNTRRSR